MPFCATCGTEHVDSDRFCGECGAALAGARPPRPPVVLASEDETGGGRPFGLPVVVGLVVLAVVVIAAVFFFTRGDGDVVAVVDESGALVAAGQSGEVDGGAVASGTVAAGGLTLRNEDGVVIEIAPGVLPEGATVEIQLTSPPELPEGVSRAGNFYRVEASTTFDDLITVRLPVPAGTDPNGLALYKVDADGELSVYSGEMGDGEYAAGVLGFSTLGLGHGGWPACTRLAGWNKRPEVEDLLSLDFSVVASALCTGAVGPFHVEYSFSDSDEVGETVLDTLGATLSFSHQFRKPGRYWLRVVTTDRATGQWNILTAEARVPADPLRISDFGVVIGDSAGDGTVPLTFKVCVQGGEPGYAVTLDVLGAVSGTADIQLGEFGYREGGCESIGPVQLTAGLATLFQVTAQDVLGETASFSQLIEPPLPLTVKLDSSPARVTVGKPVRIVATGRGGILRGENYVISEQSYDYLWRLPEVLGMHPGEKAAEVTVEFPEAGDYPISVVVFDATDAEAEAELVIRVIEGMTVEIEPSAAAPYPGQAVTLTARVTGQADDADLRYVWGLPEGDVDGAAAAVELIPAEAGLMAVGVTVFDDRNGEEADAFLELAVTEAPALVLEVIGTPATVAPGETMAIEVGISGGVVEIDGEIVPYVLDVDFGDGTAASYDIERPGAIVEHAFAGAGSYTVTLTAASPDGQTVTRTVAVATALSLVVATEFWLPEDTVVFGNEIVFSIEGTAVEITAFAYDMERADYSGFTLDSSGETQSYEVDCISASRRELTGQDLVYDPATGTITGTISLLWTRLDRGTECPFGGIDDVQERTAVIVELTLVDGVLNGQMVSEERLPRMGLFIINETE